MSTTVWYNELLEVRREYDRENIMKKQITIKALFTPQGAHTCATNFTNGNVCPLLGCKKFGSEYVCMKSRDQQILFDNTQGYLVADYTCCIFHKEE